jgi:hypothetical protein
VLLTERSNLNRAATEPRCEAFGRTTVGVDPRAP